MRLIDVATFEVKQFDDDDEIPPYSVLSHRWNADEVTLQDMQQGKTTGKPGFAKIQRLCHLTKSRSLAYCWADTCCIDKTNGAELSEAINSMYRWYANSTICIAFLCDTDADERSAFVRSSWFSRGWTLQELIAPPEMSFYDGRWKLIGSRGSLLQDIIIATGLPFCLLAKETSPPDYSVAQRLSWAVDRKTTRKEDLAYCLMGLLDVNMPLLYGEGKEKAFLRLQEEYIKRSDDMSIFAWTSASLFAYIHDSSSLGSIGTSLLASSIQCFAGCGTTRMNEKRLRENSNTEEFHVTNSGMSISLPMRNRTIFTHVAMLNCSNVHSHNGKQARCDIGILLHRLPRKDDQFTRISKDREDIVYDCQNDVPFAYQAEMIARRIFVPLESSIRFRDWSVDVSYLKNSRLDGRYSSGKLSQIHTGLSIRDPEDFPESRPSRKRYSHDELGRTIPVHGSMVSAIKFGLDSNFNPVIFVYGTSLKPIAHTMNSDFPWNDHIISDPSTDLEPQWNHHGFLALRGHCENGMKAEIHFLNLYVKIGGTKTWSVRFRPLVSTPSPVRIKQPPHPSAAWRDDNESYALVG